MIFRPVLLKVSLRKPIPPAGMWTNFLRPIQNTIVASNINPPGTPKATCGPYRSSKTGVIICERNAPKLMEK